MQVSVTKLYLRNLAIAAGISIATISCTPTPTTPKASTTPSAAATTSAASASPATPKPSASPASTPDGAAKAEKPPDTVRVSVVNNSGKELKAVYMSPPSKQTWGANELDKPIPDREKADFEWKRSDFKGEEAGCVFDVRAEYSDGASSDLDPIDLCKTPTINLK